MMWMATGQFNRVVERLRNITIREDGAGLTDGQLLGHFVDFRDEVAVAALVRRHGPMVWAACLRVLRNQHDAEDAFQATFLVLLRKAASVVPREMLANWLYGVANQTSLKARATRTKRRSREKQVMEMPEPDVLHEFHDDLQSVLDEELRRLPERFRRVVVLCDLEGKTRKQAARQLGCPEGTVASRLATARKVLAKRLQQRGLAISGGMLSAMLPEVASAVVPPRSLMVSTIEAVMKVATGQAASGPVSATVIDLTQGIVKAMFMSKLKTASAVIFVMLGLVAFGGVLLEYQPASGQQVEAKADEERTKRKANPPEPASPQAALSKGVADYKTVFNKTLEVVNDYFAVVGYANQYDGRILSHSALGKAAIEQERSDPSIRRRADIQIRASDANTFQVQVYVIKEVEIKDSPQSGETDWVRIGRDRALEEVVLQRLEAQQFGVARVAGGTDAIETVVAPDVLGEVLKIEVADLLVRIFVETDKQIVYLTSDDTKKGDETYRITDKTIVLRGDTMKRIRLAEIRPGDRVRIELPDAENRIRQIVVRKHTQ
jgi:RNA polymerase sigma factor (sigma-70 family)